MARAHDDPSVDDSQNPWTQPMFIASAIVVGIVVVLGLVLAFRGGGSSDHLDPAQSPSAGAGAQAGRIDEKTSRSHCEVAPGNQDIPRTAPRGTRWQLKGTIAVPSAAAFGPGAAKDDIPSCFAHSPTGALFATINIYAALSAVSQKGVGDPVSVLRQLIAEGPGRDVAIANARRGGAPSKESSSGVQVAGFTIVRYEPASAVIDLAFRVDRPGASGYVHATSTMRWERGDWKLTLSQEGQPFDSMQQIRDLSGYIRWSGV
jgi:hypothetical protein